MLKSFLVIHIIRGLLSWTLNEFTDREHSASCFEAVEGAILDAQRTPSQIGSIPQVALKLWKELSWTLNEGDLKATVNQSIFEFASFAEFAKSGATSAVIPALCGRDVKWE